MANIRNTLVVRKDLQLVEGLFASQAVHLAMMFIQKAQARSEENGDEGVSFEQDQYAWIKDPYLSILAVECYEDLQKVIEDCQQNKLSFYVWEDTIPSPTFEDQAMKATIGVAIGPDDFDKIKVVTNALRLY